jgi:[ribosomal protein S18]-alanine N-acetyltransferase
VVRPLTSSDAVRVARWRYEGPWRVYDPRPHTCPLNEDPAYLAVAGADSGLLVGFCCSGVEALVPGLEPADGVLDVGLGLSPSWVGQGHGPAFASAVLAHYRSTTGTGRLRAVVQSWDERSLRLTRSLGFVEVGRHRCEQGGVLVEYTILVAD